MMTTHDDAWGAQRGPGIFDQVPAAPIDGWTVRDEMAFDSRF